jgi:hypothetical protein
METTFINVAITMITLVVVGFIIPLLDWDTIVTLFKKKN